MAFSVILILSDSSQESVGTSTARVSLFGTIPTIVPATAPTADLPAIHDDTPLIPTDTPNISPIIPTIPSIAPTIRYTSPFICNDSSNSDTLNTPPSPIHDTPPTKISPSICKILPASPGLPRRPAVLVLPGQPILVGRPYPDYSSLDHFTSNHSSRDSPLDSSSKTSSDSHSDTSSDSSSRHSSSRHSSSGHPSPTTSVPVASPVTRALSPVVSEKGDVPTMYEEPIKREEGRYDTAEPVREDFPELVSADRSLEVMQRGLDIVMQELYDHMVEIPVHRVRVIESV
ncbi:hypothetical protein Tco_0161853 [Tanacetum coccineum]